MAGQKRVAAVHDLSGVGRCSLGVALPILSAAGIEANALPTAVLSTQTDGFRDFTYRDLTEDLLPAARHWHSLGLEFDAVYTGFAASGEQLELLAEIVDLFRTKETLVVIDPVMADNGALYQTFDAAFPGEMQRYVQKADLILPNVTEACLLTGRDWADRPRTQSQAEALLRELGDLCGGGVVMTGFSPEEDLLGAAILERGGHGASFCMQQRIDAAYCGTGDVFASALVACLLRGLALPAAAACAAEFTAASIRRTKEAGGTFRYGVQFELELPTFLERLVL